MSLNVRWLTNGEKNFYTVSDCLRKTLDVYFKIDEIPDEIRHYAERIKEPTFCAPELARLFGVQNIFYPDWPKPCVNPDYQDRDCIAEECKYCGPDKAWEMCQWRSKSVIELEREEKHDQQ